MENRGGADEMTRVGGERDDEDMTRERLFIVGEVVEFWEGSAVRGYRQAPGEAAFVKSVEGNGIYMIKMVGSCRGKFRSVGWQNLYKEGSFSKNICRTDSVRVRGVARLRERAQEEAEVRFVGVLRQTKRELQKVEKINKDIAKQAEERIKKQEMKARQGQKDLTAGHKRNLEDMREKLERRRDKDMKERDESLRQVRLKTREMGRDLEQTNTDLCEAIADKAELAKAVTRGIVRVDGLREHGMGWQRKHDELKDKMKEREERLTYLEGSLVVQTRELATLQRKQNDLAKIVGERNEVIELHAGVIGKV